MNRIAFRIVPSPHACGSGEVSIAIDGRDLRDLVAGVEREPAAAEGFRSLAGRYAGLAADERVLPPSRHFLGTVASRFDDVRSKVPIIGCECGEIGCWPLPCRIRIDDSKVEWSDFEQPHRRGLWDYTGLGPFTFDRLQFDEALGALTRPEAG